MSDLFWKTLSRVRIMRVVMEPNYLLAQIDLDAIEHNCRVLRSFIKPGCRFCAAVKANAYGHGIEVVLPALKSAGVDMLAVAAICEAQQLRRLGWQEPILLLGSELSIYTGRQKQEIVNWLVENTIRISVTTPEDIDALASASQALSTPAIVHLMLDSGMSRDGVNEELILKLMDQIAHHPQVVFEGLYTHFATAGERDEHFARRQLERFNVFLERLRDRNLRIPLIHAANSAATIDLPESHFDMVRPGISINGYHASPEMRNKPDLRPTMRVVSCLTLVKTIPAGSYVGYGCTFRAPCDMLIGLVPIGYGDGYDRRLSNTGKMLIDDHVVPVVGRISMDQTIVDLTALIREKVSLRPGREVVVIDNRRESPNSVEALAKILDTIPYEITTSLGPRARRVPLKLARHERV
jgi:alanine racemase